MNTRRRLLSRFRLASLTLFCLLIPACASLPKGHDRTLARQLDTLLHQYDDTGVIVSARVLELPGRRELYAFDADRPMMPASNMKLVTTAAALDFFGPQHTFKTYLTMEGNSLVVVGTGDPGVGDPVICERRGMSPYHVFDEWAEAARAKDFPATGGMVDWHEGAFEKRKQHPTWHFGDLDEGFAAPVSALCFYDNAVHVVVSPAENGQQANVAISGPPSMLGIVNQCSSGSEGDPTVEYDAKGPTLYILGTCSKTTTIKRAVRWPGSAFANSMVKRFAEQGIKLDQPMHFLHPPPGGSIPPPSEIVIATHETAIADVLWRTNKDSQNLFAECLCKMLGRAWEAAQGHDVPGSWENGGQAIHAFFEKSGIDHKRLKVIDGSGLSMWDRVTARQMTDLLAVMDAHPYREAWRDSLAVAGRDGTIKGRMKDLEGRVLAKTGFITSVRALSGYVQADDGRWLCFSILFNNIDGPVRPFEEMQDEACRVLARRK